MGIINGFSWSAIERYRIWYFINAHGRFVGFEVGEEMRDLIRRSDAIECCRNEWEEEVEKRLRALPSAPQWIPCSERLPEIEYDYLVTIRNNFVTIASFRKLEGWSVWDDEAQAWDITAWMELPEPYKENEMTNDEAQKRTKMRYIWKVYEVANTEEEQPIAWQCPFCGEIVSARYNFCPNCGEDMRRASR